MSERIDIVADDLLTIIAKLASGNVGAATCLGEFFSYTRNRPLLFAEGVRMFSFLRIYGEKIYVLWNDCLDRSTGALRDLVLAWLRGKVTAVEILQHIEGDGGRGTPLNVPVTMPRIGGSRWIN